MLFQLVIYLGTLISMTGRFSYARGPGSMRAKSTITLAADEGVELRDIK
jgi:hypothetical protein